MTRAIPASALARDEHVAEILMRGPATKQDIAKEVGVEADSVRRIVSRLRTRHGVQVQEQTVQVRCGRGSLGVIYRIVLPKGRVCAHEGCPTILRSTNPALYCELHGGGFLDFGGMT